MNKKNGLKYIVVLTIGLVSCLGCYERIDTTAVYNGEVFNFSMTAEDEEKIFSLMETQFLVDKPTPVLHLGAESVHVEKFKIRGQSTLKFHKKSFSVALERKLKVSHNGGYYYGKKFKLLSMVYDYTYIENRVALKLHEAVGIWHLPTFYAEVMINSNHKGLYLFVSDPEEYYLNYLNKNFILRREYGNRIRRFQQNKVDAKPYEEYTLKYLSVYDIIQEKEGVELYNSLNEIIDLETYFTKLAVDFLIRNGDATDEVYFYTQKIKDKELFVPIPWDCDDIFSKYPHEILGSWGTNGSIFGPRSYSTTEDIIADVGNKLLFSIEEDLDYKIATDAYLYEMYLKQLTKVIEILDEEQISDVFDEVFNEVSEFYDKMDLANLSQYDETPTSNTLFLENLEQKKMLTINQYKIVKTELDDTNN